MVKTELGSDCATFLALGSSMNVGLVAVGYESSKFRALERDMESPME